MPDDEIETELSGPPNDSISAVHFSPDGTQNLLVSSWDCTLRVYNVFRNSQQTIRRFAAPLLDCCFQDPMNAWCGGLDNSVKLFDLSLADETEIGRHDAPVRCVHYNQSRRLAITGSWDKTVKLWDPRASRTQACVATCAQPDKVYTLDSVGDRLVVGTAGRKVLVWDLRQPGTMEQRRDSSLKFQTRCIRCFPNGQGWAQSSIEGRVAVEYFDLGPELQKKKYAFKCHRVKEDGQELIYPVNALAFHPQFGTFATGGSDGFVGIWDGFNRKRLAQPHRFSTSVASLAFSPNGCQLAIGLSYMFEDGQKVPVPGNSIFVRNVTDSETKPKTMVAQ